MEFIRPSYNLSLIGFNYSDVDLLNKVLEQLDIELIDDSSQLFDFNSFTFEIIKSKSLREALIKAYQKEDAEIEQNLINNMGFDCASYHFRWSLFLLLIMSGNNYASEIKLFLDTDEAYLHYSIDIFAVFFMAYRKNYFSVNRIYNLIMDVNNIERTGWLNAEIPTNHKESISEHMFSMYHLTRMYLKDKSHLEGYNKETILRLSMIHDVVESIIGDIAYPTKNDNDEKEEENEGKALFIAYLYLTGDDSYYNDWCEWCDNSTINSLIAHDMDILQFNYRFMRYVKEYPNHFSDEEIKRWMRRSPKTMLGQELFKTIILDNELFKDLINKIE